MKVEEYVNKLIPYIVTYAKKYNVLCPSAVMAQACVETGYGNGKSQFEWRTHNHFGLKCGSKWTGKSVRSRTSEQTSSGSSYRITDSFRAYNSLAEGIEGYFIFTSAPRYANTRGVRNPETYLRNIRADGYATAVNYVSVCMSYVRKYNLTKYDSMSGADFPDIGTGTTTYQDSASTVAVNEPPQVFTAQSTEKENKWGKLRYFEEVSDPSIGQAKADILLNLYARRTRELKVSDAFGDKTVRAGTLIPVFLNLGDVETSNYMLVDKVTHKFSKDSYTMDLTLQGAWDD